MDKDKTYSWKRYWCKREGTIIYDDFGYVVEPQNFLLHNFETDLVTFESIDHYPCLILLGEPGIGKSTEISNIKEGLKFNLNLCSSGYMLFNDLFKSEEFINCVLVQREMDKRLLKIR